MIDLALAVAIQAYLLQFHNLQTEPGQVALQPTRKEFPGDLTLNVFPFVKATGLSPDALANALAQHLQTHVQGVSGTNVVKGFLNIEIADSVWLASLSETQQQAAPSGRRTMVEYSSPNTNKPQHLGHMRNNLLGQSVANILQAAGEQVVRANLINDRGVHICKSMLAWQRLANGATPQSTHTKGDHFVGHYYVEYDKLYKAEVEAAIATGTPKDEAEKTAESLLAVQEMLRQWEAGNPEVRQLWQTMNGWVYEGFHETYNRLGLTFDNFYYESNTYLLGKEIVADGLAKGVFYHRQDGAVCVDLTDEGLDEKVILRADGTSVYITQDLGTAYQRFQTENIDRCIYVVGSEQEYHFQVLKAIFKKLGLLHISNGIFHLSYGMIDLPSGRMKSREGTVVDADDLMDEMVREAATKTADLGKTESMSATELDALHETLGLGAIKYYLLRVDPKKRMTFNPAESIDLHGNTGPFIQYTHARICRLLEKASEAGIVPNANAQSEALLPSEKEMAKLLTRHTQVVQAAAANLSPALVANYAYDVAQQYNRFYQEMPVLREENVEKQALRAAIALQTKQVLSAMLALLGIKAPNRM